MADGGGSNLSRVLRLLPVALTVILITVVGCSVLYGTSAKNSEQIARMSEQLKKALELNSHHVSKRSTPLDHPGMMSSFLDRAHVSPGRDNYYYLKQYRRPATLRLVPDCGSKHADLVDGLKFRLSTESEQDERSRKVMGYVPGKLMVSIRRPGEFFIYAHMTFNEPKDPASVSVHVDDAEEPLSKCFIPSHVTNVQTAFNRYETCQLMNFVAFFKRGSHLQFHFEHQNASLVCKGSLSYIQVTRLA